MRSGRLGESGPYGVRGGARDSGLLWAAVLSRQACSRAGLVSELIALRFVRRRP